MAHVVIDGVRNGRADVIEMACDAQIRLSLNNKKPDCPELINGFSFIARLQRTDPIGFENAPTDPQGLPVPELDSPINAG